MSSNWNHQPQQRGTSSEDVAAPGTNLEDAAAPTTSPEDVAAINTNPEDAAAPGTGFLPDFDGLNMFNVFPAPGAVLVYEPIPPTAWNQSVAQYEAQRAGRAVFDPGYVQESSFFDQAMVSPPSEGVLDRLVPFGSGVDLFDNPFDPFNRGLESFDSNLDLFIAPPAQPRHDAYGGLGGLHGLVGASSGDSPAEGLANAAGGLGGMGSMGAGQLHPQHIAVRPGQSTPVTGAGVDAGAFMGNTAALPDSQGHTAALPVSQGHTAALPVSQGHTAALSPFQEQIAARFAQIQSSIASLRASQRLAASNGRRHVDAGNTQGGGLAGGIIPSIEVDEFDYDGVAREIQASNDGHLDFGAPAPAPVMSPPGPLPAAAAATTAALPAAPAATPAHAGLPGGPGVGSTYGSGPQPVAVPNIRHLTREHVGPSNDRPAQFRPLTAADWRLVAAQDLRHYSGPELRVLREGLEELVNQLGATEAQATLSLVEAYTRRRRQLANNLNARRSRRRLHMSTKYWNKLAVQHGAPDTPFVYDSQGEDEDEAK